MLNGILTNMYGLNLSILGKINHSHAYKRDVQGLKELQEHIRIIVLQLKLIL